MTKNYLLFYALLTGFLANAQTPSLVSDINPTGDSDVSLASEKSMIEFKGNLYFTANDGVNGNELWKYDGTNTELFYDINSGASGSNCDNFYVINDKLVFTADDGVNGIEWWVTDGVAANTQLVKDIDSRGDGVYFSSFASESTFIVFNDKVYFTGISENEGYELWSTDGTTDGTALVKNISFDFIASFPEDFAILNNELLFSCREGLWKTDGTEAGTVEINGDVDPGDLVTLNDKVVFWNNSSSIWTTDGTEAGTVEIKTVSRPTTNNANEKAFTVIGNNAFFAGSDDASGAELWITDGTESGTQLVLDAEPGDDGYTPQNKVVFNNKLYYKGDNGVNGIELWTSDGTAAGTYMVKDIKSGSSSGFVLPTEIYATDKYIYMSAGGSFNTNLWISDGTEEGTEEIVITEDDESKPSRFYSYNNGVFFFALNSFSVGDEPHFISEDDALSVSDSEVAYIHLYPNPTSDFAIIDNTNKSIESVTVTDITGKVVDNITNVNNTTIKVSLLNKESGIYFIKINTPYTSVTKKVIKK
ncbi:T9SS type A sorting domain-containing protein [uncultured Formosa sp.]|uniref:T9SS type A sorting domain-containing protein n=1 Tax=uncultured Formosa sp. TaxID=255435 RepID=UPI0026346713|nr:T9SS type A sorting domain-containing protein [uncultured Formosa sp.]